VVITVAVPEGALDRMAALHEQIVALHIDLADARARLAQKDRFIAELKHAVDHKDGRISELLERRR
jgi:hypothetical protein